MSFESGPQTIGGRFLLFSPSIIRTAPLLCWVARTVPPATRSASSTARSPPHAERQSTVPRSPDEGASALASAGLPADYPCCRLREGSMLLRRQVHRDVV